ncbi:MAG: hypothetical protein WAL80_16390 [Xanthobacteraceae bacterium]
MEKDIFVVQFDNGIDRRSVPTLQPDIIFAAMFGQRHANGIFGQRWNGIADQRQWKIVVLSRKGERHEEPVGAAAA